MFVLDDPKDEPKIKEIPDDGEGARLLDAALEELFGAEVAKHLMGEHDQQSHAGDGGDTTFTDKNGATRAFNIIRQKIGDGVAFKIMVDGDFVGHISGFSNDLLGKYDKIFHVYKTELSDDTLRGTGLYQKALQQVADTWENGAYVFKWEASPALQKAITKMPSYEYYPEKDALIIKPRNNLLKHLMGQHDQQSHAGDRGQGEKEVEHIESVEFYSPSEEESSTFPHARELFDSPQHRAFVQKAKEVDDRLGLKGETAEAIGDWSDGAEISVATVLRGVDSDMLEVSAATKGWLGNQKAVVTFHAGDGDQVMLWADIPKGYSLEDIRNALDDKANQVQFRTLIPQKDGTRVMVLAFDKDTIENFSKVAGKFKAQVGYENGTGKIIESTDGTRESARHLYESRIQEGIAGANGQKVAQVWGWANSQRQYREERKAARAKIDRVST